MAVSERHAAELSGFSVRRLRAWDARGLVGPSIKRQLSERNTVRLYTFDDLVELLVASALVDAGRPPRQIRRVVEHLRDRDYKAPLRELRFAVSGDRIYFQHPDGLWEGDQAPDQVVLYRVLDLEAIKARIRRSVRPSRQHEAGHVERRRGVLGSKAVFAGTRVPVAAVEAFAGPTTTRRVRPGDDRATRAAVAAERAFQRALGGGCLTPIGALATVSGATVELAGMLADPVRRKGRALIGGYTRRRWSLADDVDRVEQVRRVAFTHWRPTHHVAATPRQIRAMSPVHDLHTSVHADVEGAGVGVAAGLIEGVLIRPRGLYLRLPLIADNVVFDVAVVEGPGDGRARWDLYDGGLERVALDRDVIDSDHRVGRCGIVDQAERQRDRDNSDEDDDDGTHRDEDAASARWCRGGWLFACCCGV